MPYYSCEDGEIVIDGAGLFNPRFGDALLDAENSKCPGHLEMCCRHPARHQPQWDIQDYNNPSLPHLHLHLFPVFYRFALHTMAAKILF